ncbi:homogentisate 1,2-dioxygenase [Conexibacter woesei]|uniref:Homogentisate 1 2-dioxygenase-like protein n=1 Tax=Conexibacter woesei (strain DSM 14684 / CCUG 47730 / CIP 108061 / JCM 11494 / NBRC 100937 / ID131577) TaxID=469383 RepID=D3F4E6_CONWI|nr:homogentisate 1,2-dioxygenase [Conexibacter woesei]ADB50518.1 Homogentisate 1 2-dioxygenase-like protein [Conexibacter woesei DSM 14684]
MASITRKGEIPSTPQGYGDGTYVDEVFTLDGFFGDWAHIWRHRNPATPTRWSDERMIYNGLDSGALEPTDRSDPRGTPMTLLTGPGASVSLSRRTASMPFAEKNVDANQIRFYQQGSFRLETELGPIEVEAGDFVVIPKGMMYREIALTGDNAIVIFEVERSIALAEKLQDQLGFASLFIDYSTMELPDPAAIDGDASAETEVRVKYDGEHHFVTYDFDPLSDVVGWSGDPVLYKLNVWDIPSLGSSVGFTSPPSNAVLFAEDKSFFFNVLAAKPFPSEPAPRSSYGASSHMNDCDEVWLNHVASIAPETNGHIWLFPRTIAHPGLKVPPQYPENPPKAIREIKINFDTTAKLSWTPEAKAALLPDPLTAVYTSFYGAHAGVSADEALEHVRR